MHCFAVQQKLTQHCKSVRLQLKKLIDKNLYAVLCTENIFKFLPCLKTWQAIHSNFHFLWMGNQGPTHYSTDVHTAFSKILNSESPVLAPTFLRLTPWGGW